MFIFILQNEWFFNILGAILYSRISCMGQSMYGRLKRMEFYNFLKHFNDYFFMRSYSYLYGRLQCEVPFLLQSKNIPPSYYFHYLSQCDNIHYIILCICLERPNVKSLFYCKVKISRFVSFPKKFITSIS